MDDNTDLLTESFSSKLIFQKYLKVFLATQL
jgi:hypothetical protein